MSEENSKDLSFIHPLLQDYLISEKSKAIQAILRAINEMRDKPKISDKEERFLRYLILTNPLAGFHNGKAYPINELFLYNLKFDAIDVWLEKNDTVDSTIREIMDEAIKRILLQYLPEEAQDLLAKK